MKSPLDLAPADAKKRLLLVDDHVVVRDGTALWINQTPDMDV